MEHVGVTLNKCNLSSYVFWYMGIGNILITFW